MSQTYVSFVSDLVNQIIKRYEQGGLESLSAPERVALLTWWTSYDVSNGGFRYFYEGNLPIMKVAAAFEELGFIEAAQACRDSATFFPPEVVAEENGKTLAWLVQLWAETDDEDEGELLDRVTDFFRPFDNVIWEVGPLSAEDGQGLLATRLVEYIRTHANAFGVSLDNFPEAPLPKPVTVEKARRWPTRAAMS